MAVVVVSWDKSGEWLRLGMSKSEWVAPVIDYGVSLGFGGMMMLLLGDVGVARYASELPGCAVFHDDLAVDKNLAGNSSAVIHAAGDAHVCTKDSLDLYFFLPAAGDIDIGIGS